MTIRELLLATILLSAAGLVVYGVHMLAPPAGYIAAGLLLAAIGALFLIDGTD